MNGLSQSLEETRQLALNFLNSLFKQEKATVVALEGNLGAGKTTFTQAAGKILGINENMTSPTFVIMKVYEIDFQGFKNFIHIDAYRLEKESELLHLGWEKIVSEPENLVFIEWPENVPGLIPPDARKVSLEFIDEGTRRITLHEKS
jgi:tRNA threonylcarbamoyladenosine biosynthesis protein TsaE